MNDGLERSLALAQLEKSLNGYYPLSEGTWLKVSHKEVAKVKCEEIPVHKLMSEIDV